jgi:presenilin-like A22 family membrane protease
MKHSVKQTIKLLAWMFAAIIIAILAAPRMQEKIIVPAANPWFIAGLAVGLMLAGALLWWFLMKKITPASISIIWCMLLGYASSDIFERMVPFVSAHGWFVRFVILMTVYFCVAYGFYRLTKRMVESWEFTRKYLWVSNLLMITILGMIGAELGAIVSPLAAIIILFGAAIYDAWAVWKSGTMVKMAKYFMDIRVIPGIALAKKEEGEFAILGGGDIFFIALVSTAFYKSSISSMYITAAAMSLAVVALFAASQKKKFYPALPFIFAGLLMGLGVVWAIV